MDIKIAGTPSAVSPPLKTGTRPERRHGCEQGFLIPYLIVGDEMVGSKRWLWWLNSLKNRKIDGDALPQMEFIPNPSDPRNKKARKHIEDCIGHFALRRGRWESLKLVMDWILWGLGDKDTAYPSLDKEEHDWLHRNFKLGILQQAPHDHWGDIISERIGNGAWNPNAFFPTPEEAVKMMVEISFMERSDSKGVFALTLDPCVGTGRMLMLASNKSLFLYGNDIDPVVLRAAKINLQLFVPWAALPCQSLNEPPYYKVSRDLASAACARLMFASACYRQIKQAGAKDAPAEDPDGNQMPGPGV